MTRVAGEKWASRPELLSERREILEDAVAWFQSFGADDSKDPVVRRQAGRAYLQCTEAYMALADYDRARKMADAAAGVYQSLSDEFPNDPAPVRGLAESEEMKAHLVLFDAKYAEAITRYQKAVEFAEAAVGINPNDPESQATLADSLTSVALSYANMDPAKASEFFRRAAAIAETLLTGPDAGFRPRQILFTVLVHSGASALRQGDNASGYSQLERAHAMLTELDRLRPATARASEMLALSSRIRTSIWKLAVSPRPSVRWPRFNPKRARPHRPAVGRTSQIVSIANSQAPGPVDRGGLADALRQTT